MAAAFGVEQDGFAVEFCESALTVNGNAFFDDSGGFSGEGIETADIHPGPSGFAVFVPVFGRLRSSFGICLIAHHGIIELAVMEEGLKLFGGVFGADFEFLSPDAFAAEFMAGHVSAGIDEPDVLAVGDGCRCGGVGEGAVDLIGAFAGQVAAPEDFTAVGVEAVAAGFADPCAVFAAGFIVVFFGEFAEACEEQSVFPDGDAAVAGFGERRAPEDLVIFDDAPFFRNGFFCLEVIALSGAAVFGPVLSLGNGACK